MTWAFTRRDGSRGRRWNATRNPEVIAHFAAQHPDAVCGVALGGDDGNLGAAVMDWDALGWPVSEETLIRDRLGVLGLSEADVAAVLAAPRAGTLSGGAHSLFWEPQPEGGVLRWPKGIRAGEFAPKVDYLGNGRMAVVYDAALYLEAPPAAMPAGVVARLDSLQRRRRAERDRSRPEEFPGFGMISFRPRQSETGEPAEREGLRAELRTWTPPHFTEAAAKRQQRMLQRWPWTPQWPAPSAGHRNVRLFTETCAWLLEGGANVAEYAAAQNAALFGEDALPGAEAVGIGVKLERWDARRREGQRRKGLRGGRIRRARIRRRDRAILREREAGASIAELTAKYPLCIRAIYDARQRALRERERVEARAASIRAREHAEAASPGGAIGSERTPSRGAPFPPAPIWGGANGGAAPSGAAAVQRGPPVHTIKQQRLQRSPRSISRRSGAAAQDAPNNERGWPKGQGWLLMRLAMRLARPRARRGRECVITSAGAPR